MKEFADADLNQDGIIDEQEWAALKIEFERKRLEDEDADRDLKREQEAQRYEQQAKMVWFALLGLLLYPLLVFGTEALGFTNASGVISDMAPTYFMAVSVIVGAYFSADAFVKAKGKDKDA